MLLRFFWKSSTTVALEELVWKLFRHIWVTDHVCTIEWYEINWLPSLLRYSLEVPSRSSFLVLLSYINNTHQEICDLTRKVEIETKWINQGNLLYCLLMIMNSSAAQRTEAQLLVISRYSMEKTEKWLRLNSLKVNQSKSSFVI